MIRWYQLFDSFVERKSRERKMDRHIFMSGRKRWLVDNSTHLICSFVLLSSTMTSHHRHLTDCLSPVGNTHTHTHTHTLSSISDDLTIVIIPFSHSPRRVSIYALFNLSLLFTCFLPIEYEILIDHLKRHEGRIVCWYLLLRSRMCWNLFAWWRCTSASN